MVRQSWLAGAWRYQHLAAVGINPRKIRFDVRPIKCKANHQENYFSIANLCHKTRLERPFTLTSKEAASPTTLLKGCKGSRQESIIH